MKKYSELTGQRTTLADKVPLRTPFGMFIDPTNFCNFHCTFCPRNLPEFPDHAGPYCHMPFALFEKILTGEGGLLSFPDRLKVLRLYFLGEPLCNPDFFKMLEFSFRMRAAERLEITTNASLLNQERAEKLLRIAKQYPETPLYMRYSIEALDAERFRALTKSPLHPEQIRENVIQFQVMRNALGADNVQTYVKMLESLSEKENQQFLRDYAGTADEVQLEKPMNWSGAEGSDLLGMTYGEEDAVRIRKKNLHRVPRVCEYPFTTLAVNADGTVVCCCVDWTRATQIGDLKTETLAEIWNGERLRQIRCEHLSGKRENIEACRRCMQLPDPERNGIGVLDEAAAELLERFKAER